MYTAHFMVYSANCVMYTAHCIPNNVLCKVNIAHSILHTAHCTLHTAHYTNAHCTLHCSVACILETAHLMTFTRQTVNSSLDMFSKWWSASHYMIALYTEEEIIEKIGEVQSYSYVTLRELQPLNAEMA